MAMMVLIFKQRSRGKGCLVRQPLQIDQPEELSYRADVIVLSE
jgi:hypothetical protein